MLVSLQTHHVYSQALVNLGTDGVGYHTHSWHVCLPNPNYIIPCYSTWLEMVYSVIVGFSLHWCTTPTRLQFGLCSLCLSSRKWFLQRVSSKPSPSRWIHQTIQPHPHNINASWATGEIENTFSFTVVLMLMCEPDCLAADLWTILPHLTVTDATDNEMLSSCLLQAVSGGCMGSEDVIMFISST